MISNCSLLSQITGISRELAGKLCRNGLYELRGKTDQLEMVYGLSPAEAKRVSMVIEFANRMDVAKPRTAHITDARQAYDLLRPEIIGAKQEMFFLIMLDDAHRVIDHMLLSLGDRDRCKVPFNILVRECLMHNAHAAIIAHNHPSGECLPSAQDVKITLEIGHALEIMDMQLLDHIVMTDNAYRSINLDVDLALLEEDIPLTDRKYHFVG